MQSQAGEKQSAARLQGAEQRVQQLTAEVERLQGFQTKAEEWGALSEEVTRLRDEVSSAKVMLCRHT